jgi:type III pantothenate kinase
VPQINDILVQACEAQFQVTPVFVRHENIDIKINIDKPAQLGTDRMVGASAAVAYYQAPCIIVDFGTATTFDVIDSEGVLQGGVISSGVNLSLSALEQAAAQLPDIQIEAPKQVVGKNTVDAMQSGIYWGYISMVEGVITKIAEEMGQKPYVIVTGGLAPLFERGTDIFNIIDQDLIMKGLVHMHKVLSKGV